VGKDAPAKTILIPPSRAIQANPAKTKKTQAKENLGRAILVKAIRGNPIPDRETLIRVVNGTASATPGRRGLEPAPLYLSRKEQTRRNVQ
jgi:hypothetical protein